MKKSLLIIASLLILMGYQSSTFAQEQARKTYAYFSLEPDIVTNFISTNTSSRKLGYVRVSIELMLNDPEYLEAAEHHSPLLKAAVIEIFGRQSAEKVTALTGREDIRRTCLEKLRELMLEETGSEMINEVIFTKYIHHQG
ncbi:flagellar basal body-associated protein FliL [uncultured Paraglaciecola sp.]|uniref:flagellar basal body-associated protein FliL n=1 Tax=uncultured Paraglaciecola sp. TaxID=1765024 RepID=UPI002597C832|nr:flagellar basal body-associated protein FliL [uncultured Paraglaciecola sp.]